MGQFNAPIQPRICPTSCPTRDKRLSCRAGAASSRSSDTCKGQWDWFPGLDQRTKGLRPRPGQGPVCSVPVLFLRAGVSAAIQRSPPYCQGSSQPLRQARPLLRSPTAQSPVVAAAESRPCGDWLAIQCRFNLIWQRCQFCIGGKQVLDFVICPIW